MATFLPRSAACFVALTICGLIGFDALTLDAAPPRTNRTRSSGTTGRRPTTTGPASKTGTKPATKAVPPPTDMPTPPQPRREPETTVPPAPLVIKPAETEPAPTQPAKVQPRTSELFAPPPIAASTDKNGKYLLRYQFTKGETVRWLVEHRAKIATTVQGSSQTAETVTQSVKAWKVTAVSPDAVKFVNLVESIDMRQKLTGRQETHYNSRTDKEVPPIFASAAEQIGVPLAEVTMDARGNVQKRGDLRKIGKDGAPVETATTDITIVLPDAPLAVGESWTAPFELSATDEQKQRKLIKARRKITLENVSGNTAVLRHETQILSPLNDPAVEAQVVQSEQSGRILFDLARGRILELSQSNDREVFGFQGEASVMHVEAAFLERLADAAGEVDPTVEAAHAATDTANPQPAQEVSSPQPTARPATGDDKTARRPEGATPK